MDKPITVAFRWSAEEMLLAQRLHMRHSRQGRKIRRLVIGGAALFLLLGIAGLAKGRDFFAAAFPFFLLAGVFLAMPLFTRRAVLKMYEQKPDRDMVVTYQISTDSIAAQSDVASSSILWRTIIRAHRTPEGFLLYPTDQVFYWLPMRGFQDSADIERLAQLAKTNAKEYKTVAGAS
jgi:hypothetical protein